MGISYHQAINSDGSLQHYAAAFNPVALFQAPPNHQQTGISYHQPINSDGSFQHYAATFNPMALFQAPPNHQQTGISYHQPINSDGSFHHYAAAFNPMALFQAPPNHRRRELAITNQSIHMEAYNNMQPPVCLNQPPVCLNQVPTIKPGASSCCCCGSNNKELMPAVVAYKPPLSKSEKRSKVAKKTGKAVVHCASVVGATAAALALL
ncbi:hypothetical protein FNV43_RR02239 [Rhamnella rubrinervis]|uniref:Uncharacterized protein n=1 Tax=Rhamnella rubrinervis TaxID=2594499 RepID=A0A8K0MST2_9ROSA|nr:hypothetical protein FNV43_RR02239 [Rhamnella rubrinervis]